MKATSSLKLVKGELIALSVSPLTELNTVSGVAPLCGIICFIHTSRCLLSPKLQRLSSVYLSPIGFLTALRIIGSLNTTLDIYSCLSFVSPIIAIATRIYGIGILNGIKRYLELSKVIHKSLQTVTALKG